ncbi:MAG: hypothetical protein JWM98_3288 [Thermoleophilia bacterium]|nr:hypothetical protein [Thermoleophilia bacterium]
MAAVMPALGHPHARTRTQRALAQLPALAVAMVCLLAFAAPAHAALSAVPTGSAVAGGKVWSLAKLNGKVYAGGSFTAAGPTTGSAVVTDLANGTWDPSWPAFSGGGANGETATPDGAGGYFVGGAFSKVGPSSAHPYLVHLRADRTVDPVFAATPNNIVRKVYLSGTTLYVAGQFTTMNGGACSQLAALNATTGALLGTWTCPTGITAGYFEAITVQGGRVYAGGNGVTGTRAGVVAYDASTGAVDAGFNATITGGAASVLGMRATAAGLYLGGSFTSAGGSARTNVALVNLATGVAVAGFNSGAMTGPRVYDVVPSGSLLYLVGVFSNVAGTARNNVAAVNATTGVLDPTFNPNVAGADVRGIEVLGGKVYVGGTFTTVGGQARSNVAAVDATTGAVDANWKPQTSDVVNELATAGADMFLAGDFTATNMVLRNHLAAFDAATGQLDLAWDPNVTGADVRSIAPNAAGTGLYIGGAFSQVGGVARTNSALVNTAAAGAVDPTFNPAPNNRVDAIAANATRVFLGGTFTTVNSGAGARSYLASVDSATGAYDAAFNATVTGTDVLALTLDPSGLYVGGNFTAIGGQSRSRAARLALASGLADSWDPSPNSDVNGIVVQGSRVYLHGLFSLLGATTRQGAAAVDAVTGTTIDPWNPLANTPNSVSSIVPYGSKVIVAGGYTKLAAVSRSYMGIVDSANGTTIDPWNPLLNAIVEDVVVTPNFVVAGGSFTTSNGTLQQGLAWFPAGPTILDNQGGDATVRRSNSGTYDVDFADTDGLASFDVQVWSGPGRTGTMRQDWTQVATMAGTSYTTNWSLPASTFAAMPDGLSYVSIRATSSVGTASTLSDVFTVTVDRSPWSMYTADADASTGAANPLGIGTTPHFSWLNQDAPADRQRVQVLSDSPDHVIGLWHLDGNGTAAVGNNMVAAGGAPTYPVGKANFGQAVNMVGTPDFLESASTAAQDTAVYTVDAWFRIPLANVNTGTAHNMIVNKQISSGSNRTYGLGLRGSGGTTGTGVCVSSDGTTANPTINGTTVIADNTWHHLACTADATGVQRLYVDGVLEASSGAQTIYNSPGGTIRIGHSNGSTDYFNGTIDEVRILDVPATAADLLAYVRTGQPHAKLMWDSNPADTGAPLTASCATGARCADVVYGSSGSAAAALSPSGARYWVRAKFMTPGNAWSAWSTYDWFATGASITVSLDSGTKSFGATAGGADVTATSTVSVSTANPNGYSLQVVDSSSTTALTAGANSIADWTGTDASPSAWSAGTSGATGYFGVTVLSVAGSTTTKPAKWGTGTVATDFTNNRYAGVRASPPDTLFNRTTAYGGVDTIVVGLRATLAASQAAGSYAGTITYVAVANP